MQGVWGLTGGIGSGKTTVAELLERHGARVIDADQVARDVVAPGSDGLAAVVDAFDASLLRADGSLDREALGARVFADPAARATLNGVLHPRIALLSGQRMMEALASDRRPVFYDAALLVENGAWRMFDGLVVVDVDTDTQRARVMARNGLSAAEAQARIDAQASREQRLAVATHVIDNSGPIEALEPQIVALLETLRAAGGHA